MIRHSVIIKLKPELGSEDKKAFFTAVDTLSDIPGVTKFEVLKQVSAKNAFEYGISMEFKDQKTYDGYSNHPLHTAFLQNFWAKSVVDFLEIDYVLI
jgi:heme-degrading monooxygenase HmoA